VPRDDEAPSPKGQPAAFAAGLLNLLPGVLLCILVATLSFGFEGLELHLFESYEPAPLSQHFCLRVDAGLEELRRRLEDAGVETHDTDEIVGRPRFFCRDPFGNRVELTEWRAA